MFTTRTSTIGLLASTCLAVTIATSAFVTPANAATSIDIPAFNCKDPAVIAQLAAMKAQLERQLDAQNRARDRDQKALDDAHAAREKDLQLSRAGADAWPAGFNPELDLGRQDLIIDKLERDLPVEDRAIQLTTDNLAAVDRALEAIDHMGPCEPPKPIVIGPPMTPPVLAGPPVVPPVVDPPPAVDPPYHPTSGFIDPPKKVEPEEPSTWERFKRWCRGVLECQTEEDEKRDHREALEKARQERRTQTRTEQTGSNTVKATTGHAVPTAKVEDHARTATARTNTAHVASVPNRAAVHGRALANVAATRMGGLQTAGLGNRTTGLTAMHPGGLGSLGGMRTGGMGGVGGMRMGATHMGGGMGGMHMGSFARR